MSQIDSVFLNAASIAVFTTGTITPAATAAATSVEQSFTVTGQPSTLKATDIVFVNSAAGSGNATAVTGARINSTGQLVLNITNPTAGSLTHAAGTFTVFVVRP